MSDPRIEAYVPDALKGAKTVLNVGAGSDSYEPDDKYVVAVEPSSVLRSQRIASNRVPAVIASAESLPFDDKSFDASMSLFSVHH